MTDKKDNSDDSNNDSTDRPPEVEPTDTNQTDNKSDSTKKTHGHVKLIRPSAIEDTEHIDFCMDLSLPKNQENQENS